VKSSLYRALISYSRGVDSKKVLNSIIVLHHFLFIIKLKAQVL